MLKWTKYKVVSLNFLRSRKLVGITTISLWLYSWIRRPTKEGAKSLHKSPASRPSITKISRRPKRSRSGSARPPTSSSWNCKLTSIPAASLIMASSDSLFTTTSRIKYLQWKPKMDQFTISRGIKAVRNLSWLVVSCLPQSKCSTNKTKLFFNSARSIATASTGVTWVDLCAWQVLEISTAKWRSGISSN